MKELYDNTTTILVTHSMSIVKNIADRVSLLQKGQKIFDHNVTDGINYYNTMMQ